MTIHKVTITDEELKEAVQAWLSHRGITLPVSEVSKQYTWKTESEVTFVTEEEKAAPPSPEPAALPEPSEAILEEAAKSEIPL